jgi:hypothetical protein
LKQMEKEEESRGGNEKEIKQVGKKPEMEERY